MSTVEQQLYTPDDLLQMPDGDRYELVDGQLVEQEDMGGKSVWAGGQVFFELVLYAKANGGWAFMDGVGYQCYPFAPDQVRKPDASFVCAGRFENDEIPDGHIRIPPDLAVEVVSPNDLFKNVEGKVDEYLRAGVKMVWVIDPKFCTIRIFRDRIGNARQIGPNDELTGDDVLPGFRCQVSELFPKPKESDTLASEKESAEYTSSGDE